MKIPDALNTRGPSVTAMYVSLGNWWMKSSKRMDTLQTAVCGSKYKSQSYCGKCLRMAATLK